MSKRLWLAAGLIAAECAGRVWRNRQRAQPVDDPPPDARRLLLPSGRLLCFREGGDPDGIPVFYCHGAMGSRQEWPWRLSARSGVRVIAWERPGFGYSGPVARRSFLDAADELAFLADALEIERFQLIAWSTGCPHAFACALRLPGRVQHVHAMGCPAPLAEAGSWAHYGVEVLTPTYMARWCPGLLTWTGQFLRTEHQHGNRLFPQAIRFEVFTQCPPLARDAAFVWHIQASHGEALRQGSHGVLQDLELYSQPWGFRLADVATPVTLWHGAADRAVHPANAYRVAAMLPQAQVQVIPGETHFLPYGQQERLLAALRETASSGLPPHRLCDKINRSFHGRDP